MNCTSHGTFSLVCMTEYTLMPPVLGCRPTPLNIKMNRWFSTVLSISHRHFCDYPKKVFPCSLYKGQGRPPRRTSLNVWRLYPTKCCAWEPFSDRDVCPLGCHRCFYFAEEVETHYYNKEHCKQMSVTVKAFYVLFTAVPAAHFNYFITFSDFIN